METAFTPFWDDLRVLLAVHRHRSFLSAGKVLGMSTSTTSRRIDALEAAMGRKLVNRSRQGVQLEADARSLIHLAEEMERGLDVVRRDGNTMAGSIKVSVPEGAAFGVTEALLAFSRAHPEVDIELLAENKLSDIAMREADLGLRVSRSTSRVLVEKRLGALQMAIFASPTYAQHKIPTRRLAPKDVAQHAFVGLDKQWRALPHEQWMIALGATRFVFRSNATAAIIEAVRQGIGIGALTERDGHNAGLVRIDVGSTGPTYPLYLVYHRELRKLPRIQAVVAALEGHLRQRR